MSEIICPYCCARFQPTRMVFRLKKSLDMNEVSGETKQWEVSGRTSGRKKKIDENLKHYYMNFENMDERTAENNAGFDAEAIEINFADMMNDITDYNQQMYRDHKFVLELTYKGQRLTQRLCPECHNELIPNAGLYDMKIIAMYGDTNAGKTVYLNILEAALRGDQRLNTEQTAFRGTMFYQGNDQELEEHNKNYELLVGKHTLPEATHGGQIVRPQVFRYCYNTAERPGEDKNLLIVFRDIPGEDTRSPEKMQRYGFYLKNADGIIVLLDATKLTQVIPFLHTEGADLGNLIVSQAVGNLSDLLTAVNGGRKIDTPTAVALAKADVLSYVLQNESAKLFSDVINDRNTKHMSYVDRKSIKEQDKAVQKILENLREATTILNPIDHCFSNSSYFAVSALGENPRKDEDNIQTVSSIRPLRVTEPFYWILAKLNCIPYFHSEKWKNSKKGEVRTVNMYYFESERNGKASTRCEELKENAGIKNGFFRGKWELVERNDSI